MKTLFALMLAVAVCEGAYDPQVGTNFGSCTPRDYSSSIQSPGDSGASASGPGDAGSAGSSAGATGK